jgi:hypothetical protein
VSHTNIITKDKVTIYGIDIPLGFGVEDVLELNGRGDLEWGLAFVQRLERIRMRG